MGKERGDSDEVAGDAFTVECKFDGRWVRGEYRGAGFVRNGGGCVYRSESVILQYSSFPHHVGIDEPVPKADGLSSQRFNISRG